MRTHKKFPKCELCHKPVDVTLAMSDAQGNKAHIYCVVKLNGIGRLVDEAVQKDTSRKTQNKPKKVTA